MEVGDKSRFAIECLKADSSEQEGHLLLYVNGERFGQAAFEYDVGIALRKFEELLIEGDFYAPELLDLNADDFGHLVESMYEDIEDERHPATFKYYEKLDTSLIVRLGYYAFDRCLIGIASNGVEEKIYVIDHDSGRKESQVLPLGSIREVVGRAREYWSKGSKADGGS